MMGEKSFLQRPIVEATGAISAPETGKKCSLQSAVTSRGGTTAITLVSNNVEGEI